MRNFNIDDFISLYNSYTGCKNSINHWFLRNYPDLCKDAEYNCIFWNRQDKKLSLTQKLIFLAFGIHDYQKCPVCGKTTYNLPDIKRLDEYKKNLEILTMCKSCYYKSHLYQDKMKQRYLEKYGVDNPNKLQSVKDKIQKTLHDHYGDDGLKSKEIHDKKVATCIEKYGTEYSCQSKEVKDKIQATFDEKYNGHPLKDEEIKKKFQDTCIEHFGFNHYMKNESVKRKVIQSNKDNHGGEFFTNREKAEKTCIEKYGETNVSKVKYVKDKKIESSQLKYGTDYVFQAQEVKDSIKETLIKRYNVENPSQSKTIHDKQVESITIIKRTVSYDKFNHTNPDYLIITPLEKYISMDFSKEKVLFKCKHCGDIIESISTSSSYRLPRCWKCFPKIISKYEIEILNFIKNKFNVDVYCNKRNIIPPKELDLYIPSINSAIEFNGLRWHSEMYQDDQNYHQNKTLLCENKNIHLIHIFEDEWCYQNQHTQIMLESILFGKDLSDDCNIEYQSDNAIYLKSKNNDIIATIQFENHKLYNFTIHQNYSSFQIIKCLISKIEKNNKILKIELPAQWFTKHFLDSIGYVSKTISQPKFSYIVENMRESINDVKDYLGYDYIDSMNDTENMKNNGYYRIFDCGNYLFEKIY